MDIKDINKFFLHQANYYALLQIKDKLKISNDCFPINIKKYANTSCTSIAILLAEEKQYHQDNIIMAGFEVGLSICVALFNKLEFESKLLFVN